MTKTKTPKMTIHFANLFAENTDLTAEFVTDGSFDNFADAISCARNVQLPEDTLSEDGYIALMNN